MTAQIIVLLLNSISFSLHCKLAACYALADFQLTILTLALDESDKISTLLSLLETGEDHLSTRHVLSRKSQ